MHFKNLAKPLLLLTPTHQRVNRTQMDVMRWAQVPSFRRKVAAQAAKPPTTLSSHAHCVWLLHPPKNSSMELCSGAYFLSSSHTLTAAVEKRNHNKHAGVEMNKLFFTAGRIPADERCSILSFGKTTLWSFILVYVF